MKTTGDIKVHGHTVLGIELGSTRIKAVLIARDGTVLASGEHGWENTLADGHWTYSMDDVWAGLQAAVADVRSDIARRKCPHGLESVGAMGVSAMMHGYLAFGDDDRLLVPFRTWRNTTTGPAAEELTRLFHYPIPQRWSIAHLYQAILNGEDHVASVAHATTLAGAVHWKLTGRNVLGVGDASGMFPIDTRTGDFNAAFISHFDRLVRDRGLSRGVREILPAVLRAGEPAGTLTEEGARLLDPSGSLPAGIPLCPPEGDAGTGMVATNSVEVRTGNVSAGTSVFAMIVLEHELRRAHHEIDLVTTPDGKLVGMAHSNNCSSDLDAWVGLLGEAARMLGAEVATSDLYAKLLGAALHGDADGGGLLTYGYVSGEHITGFEEGRPLFVRSTNSRFTVANFMRAHLMSALCALRTGLKILVEEEGVRVDQIRGHGGFFKTEGVGQRIMAAATGVPVSLVETAGEGGAWGIALLAAYLLRENAEESLPAFLKPVFARGSGNVLSPDPADVAGFDRFFQLYQTGLSIERAAVEALP